MSHFLTQAGLCSGSASASGSAFALEDVSFGQKSGDARMFPKLQQAGQIYLEKQNMRVDWMAGGIPFTSFRTSLSEDSVQT